MTYTAMIFAYRPDYHLQLGDYDTVLDAVEAVANRCHDDPDLADYTDYAILHDGDGGPSASGTISSLFE